MWIIIVAIIVIILLWVVSAYNSLVRLRGKVKNQWSQIEIVLKKRADLIPNLVETVKGYAGHEKDTLEAVVAARNKYVAAPSVDEEMKASGELTSALNRLFALTEAYPELKANENFISLQSDLKDTEDKIQYARQFYNDAAMKYNNKLQTIPTNIVGSIFNFKPEKYFEASEEDKEVPQVKF